MTIRLLLALALLALAPAAANAQTTATSVIREAAQALRSDPVYIDPAADGAISNAEADQLRDRIRSEAGGPVYIAILSERALAEGGGQINGVGAALVQAVNQRGVYAILLARSSGRFTIAAGDAGENVRAAQLAEEARQARGGDGPAAVLGDFVTRVGQTRRGEGTSSGRGSGSGGSGAGEGGGFGGGGLLLLLLGGGGALLLLSRRRRRKAEQVREVDEFADVQVAARDDLVALGEDIRALDLDVEMPGVDPRAKADYDEAVRLYEKASDTFDVAKRPEDLEPMTEALEQGRYAMASAKARLAGHEPPERRPPCFFDPRHGPSVDDVEWTPPGGSPRMVPACAADRQRIEDGIEPQTREVMVGGQATPYYQAGPAFGPWAGGFFGGVGGGLLPGLLIGSMLGGGMGFGYPDVAHGDGGDFGGGDFGGGDFGGGDFGGGDFGGGDFGGGE